jgi:hypothetical protein
MDPILTPLAVRGAFALGTKIISGLGRNKKAAALLLRMQESDLRGLSTRLASMIQADKPADKEMLAFIHDLILRAADISDKAADVLVGDDDA